MAAWLAASFLSNDVVYKIAVVEGETKAVSDGGMCQTFYEIVVECSIVTLLQISL